MSTAKINKIVVLASGSGTTLEKLIESTQNGEIPNSEIVLVVADRDCYALERAKNHGIPTALISRGKDWSENFNEILPKEVDLIVLAGFLSILSPDFTKKYSRKIINIHPALLPKFGGAGMYGKNVHTAVFENKEKISGATVHFVDAGIDEGEIILQKQVDISKANSADEIAQLVQNLEKSLYPKAIAKVLSNE